MKCSEVQSSYTYFFDLQGNPEELKEVCDGEPHAVLEEAEEEENSFVEHLPATPEEYPSLLSFGNQVDINVIKMQIRSHRTSRHPNLPVLGSTELSFRDPRASINETFVEPKTVADTKQVRIVKCYNKQLKKMVQVSYLKKSAVTDKKLAAQVMLNTARAQVKDAQAGKGPAVIAFCAFNTISQEDDAYHTIGLVTH